MDDWIAAFRVVPDVDGIPVIGEVRVFPAERERPPEWSGRWSAEVLGFQAKAPRGGLTARQFRQLPIGRRSDFLREVIEIYQRERRETLEKWGKLDPWLTDSPAASWLSTALETAAPSSRSRAVRPAGPQRGRKPIPDIELARLASDYVHFRSHRRLAKKWNKSEAVVKNRIYEARLRGLLPRTEEGDRGMMMLTPKAEALLRRPHDQAEGSPFGHPGKRL